MRGLCRDIRIQVFSQDFCTEYSATLVRVKVFYLKKKVWDDPIFFFIQKRIGLSLEKMKLETMKWKLTMASDMHGHTYVELIDNTKIENEVDQNNLD